MITGRKILITGGGGFIGTALSKRLSKDNDVTLFDIRFGETDMTLFDMRFGETVDRKARLVIGDIRRADDVTPVVSCQDIVIHTAARVGVQEVIADTIETLNVNYNGTANVLRALQSSRTCERAVLFSTSEIYGINALNVSEDDPLTFPSTNGTRWCYGIGKLAAEHLGIGYHQKYGLPVVIIRPFNVFGAGRTGKHAMLDFITRALNDEPLTLYNNGTQLRAWCYIDDFCDAVLRTLDTPQAVGRAFNIGNPGNTVTMSDLARMVIRMCESGSRVRYETQPFVDIPARIPDIGLARSVLGFEPKVDLEDGIRRTIDWAKAE